MRKIAWVIALITVIGIVACSCGGGEGTGTVVKEGGLELVRSYPETEYGATNALAQGSLYKAEKINVLVLQGTYRQMGEQYGELLKDELTEDYEGIVEGLKDLGLSLEDLQQFGDDIYRKYPQKYKEIIEGLGDCSGLGLEKAVVLNAQEQYVGAVLAEWAEEHYGKCSGLAAWGPYTESGTLVFGRNYDLGPTNHQYATMVVYNPIDGSIPTASFTYAGCIYVTSGMNSSGVFLELNNGSASDKGDFSETRPWAPVMLFSFLEQSASLDQLTAFFNTTNPDLAYIVQGADENGAVSFEWSTTGVKARGPDRDGLLSATNYFVEPSWDIPPPDDGVDASVGRRENLLGLADQNKGKINTEVMTEIIATPLEDGGAFRAPNLTSYEIVAEPGSLTVWVRVPEYQDWVEVDLGPLFVQKPLQPEGE